MVFLQALLTLRMIKLKAGALMKILYIVILAAGCFALYVFMHTRKGMQSCKKCEARYKELAGLNDLDAFFIISKEQNPQFSDDVHIAVASKCRDIYELGNFIGVVFTNPIPDSDDTALDLINSSTISESGFPVW